MDFLRLVGAALIVAITLAMSVANGRLDAPAGDRERADKLYHDGNYQTAYTTYRSLVLDAKPDRDRVGSALSQAILCLSHLGRLDEADAFRESAVAVHPRNWRLLQAAAESYLEDNQHLGMIVGGKFHRGQQRSEGQHVGSYERDRSRALQLLVQGLESAQSDPDHAAAGGYLLTLEKALLGERTGSESWRLQTKTPLDVLPDYAGDLYRFRGTFDAARAPVEPDGTPVYYPAPGRFEEAANDGQRWRWALAQASRVDPTRLNSTRLKRADFAVSQFGTQTIADSPFGGELAGGPAGDSGPYALETLGDDETIARLATGIKRFKIPDEYNPIKIYETIVRDPETGHGETALGGLEILFENRRQYGRAATYLEESRILHGDNTNGRKKKKIAQILEPWGQFEPQSTQPAGRGAALAYRFRNGHRVHFEAHEVLVGKLLQDVQGYLASSPKQIDWQESDLSDIGARLVARNQQQYLGRAVARWDLDVEPLPDHHDKRIDVTTPLQTAGAYLVVARLDGGNTSRIVVWLDDTVIVKKPLAAKTYYFVADARTGLPVPQADLALFGWRIVQENGKNQFRIEIQNLIQKTDDQGQIQVAVDNPNDVRGTYQWLITARTAEGRFAHLGFTGNWAFPDQESSSAEIKVFVITDRPVYRPGAPVKFKFWVARARYDQSASSEFAGKSFAIEVRDPRGDKVYTCKVKADTLGGFDGSFALPNDAALGVYQVVTPDLGGGSFRVEEYKKPEFEVTVDSPTKPAMLGEKVLATVRARYYFGGPVTEALVKYKITRTEAFEQWYPAGRWDWLFGRGYWWFAADSPWYPGWSQWGMKRPVASWAVHDHTPPEVVAEAVVAIRSDGTLPIEIDTELARAVHPGHDQRYEIVAEITDQSRRTIVGTGTVLVASKPFRVYTWVDRGHYSVGDAIDVSISAQTLAQKPVAGKGTLAIKRIAYDAERRPVETNVESWDLTLDDGGQTHQLIKASAPGQYRLAVTIDDGSGHRVLGGYLLTITGPRDDGATFRYSNLEVIPERKEYRPGETLRLLINTNQPNSTVLLFLRPVNGVYLPPKIVRLNGKSTVEEIGIVPRDMPNFFVEALTVADGKVHDDVREIAVPPESRVVNIVVEPSQVTYKPGEKATLNLRLTGPEGKPFAGSTVLLVYDKAVEYISGGSNVPDIKEWFWKWKRSHHPLTESSLDRWFGSLLTAGEIGMQDLGVFGGLFEDEIPAMPQAGEGRIRRRAGMGRMGGAMMKAQGVPMAAPADAAAPPAAPPPAPVLSPGVPPVVRTNFADTAFWNATVITAEDGTARIDFTLPQSLTTWKVKGWTMGAGTRVGQTESEIVTTKSLLVRMQGPRFFVEKDEVVLSAIVHNKLKTAKDVQVVLELDGNVLEGLDQSTQQALIAAGAEHRVDWRVKVAHEGQAVIRMKALTDEESDAAQMTFPASVHGMQKTEAFAGTIRPDQERAEFVINIPPERQPALSRLEVRYSPSLAASLVDALPYLADYPYGCTEQTLNRFLPTVITQKVLIDLGIDLKAVRQKQTNLNAQQQGDARDRGKEWKAYDHNPVFDSDEVTKMANAGLTRLADMQLADGGWGWFSGFGEYASTHTTALVVHGLQVARSSDLKIANGMLERGVSWLSTYQAGQAHLLENCQSKIEPFKAFADDTDALVFMVLTDAGVRHDKMLGYLDRDRPRISVYGKALFGLALERLGEKEKLASVLMNIRQYVVRDDENQTAYLKLPNEHYWWSWYGSEIETDAFCLKLLARTDPRGELAPRLVKYVLNNRKHGRYWNSTRDTAFCIEAMADYLRASGEDRPDMTVTLSLDGQSRKEVKIAPADLFGSDRGYVLEGPVLETGARSLSIVKQGKGPLYFSAYLTNFTLEDPIAHSGLEIKVVRKVYRLVKQDQIVNVAGARGQTVGQRIEHDRRELVTDDSSLKSGERVEVELEIESKNDYEYLMLEDYKAAGFEPLETRSGYNESTLGAYVEFRDDRTVFFVRSLARGKQSVFYRMRAEIPGRFHALPARATAMYAPDLRANSDEIRLQIHD
jgi:uncharacterized protein YfaS (alpha-2-macroglobulin family)